MAGQTDIYMTPTDDGLYAFAGVTDDIIKRIQTRFITQFLSVLETEAVRGASFMNMLNAGALKTNADIVTSFGTASSQVKLVLQRLAKDAYLKSVELLSYEILSNTTLQLTFRLNTVAGSVITNTIVVQQ